MAVLLPLLRKRGNRKGLENDEKEENMAETFWAGVLFTVLRGLRFNRLETKKNPRWKRRKPVQRIVHKDINELRISPHNIILHSVATRDSSVDANLNRVISHVSSAKLAALLYTTPRCRVVDIKTSNSYPYSPIEPCDVNHQMECWYGSRRWVEFHGFEANKTSQGERIAKRVSDGKRSRDDFVSKCVVIDWWVLASVCQNRVKVLSSYFIEGFRAVFYGSSEHTIS